MNKKAALLLIVFIGASLMGGCSSLQIRIPEIPEIADRIEALMPATPTPPITPPQVPTPAPGAYVPSLSELQNACEQIYTNVLPSVVSINVTTTITQTLPSLPDFPFEFNLPDDELPREYQQQGAGSGFVWDKEGHIITNNHVIQGATAIRVRFSDGTSVVGEVVGADTDSDLAVIKVDMPEEQLQPIQLADSTQVRVGQIAIAIGNPFQLEGSMTVGIVSGIGRSLFLGSIDNSGLSYSIPDVIQTDAAINPGNSGGVLVDINGRLIGVTTAIESPVRANTGIGYVVPSIIVQKVAPVLIEEGDYDHPWIGISGRDVNPEVAELMGIAQDQRGALVVDITPGSPADEAGLKGSDKEAKVNGQDVRVGGDVITAIDGQPVDDFEDLVAYLARYTYVDQTIELTVLRDGSTERIPLTLAARPKSSEPLVTQQEISSGAWLGITGMDVTEEIAEAMNLRRDTKGVLILQVNAGGPADEAGLRGSFKPIEIDGEQVLIGGDIITALNEIKIESIRQLSQEVGNFEPGQVVNIKFLRDGRTNSLEVELGKKPE